MGPNRVDLGVLVMKACSTFFRAPELKSHHQMQFSVISRKLVWCLHGGGSYPSAEMQSAYSTAQADWAENSI